MKQGAGSYNSLFGYYSGGSITVGQDNSMFGEAAGNLTTGSGNSFFGSSAGLVNSSASNNSFFGARSGRSNTTGSGQAFLDLSRDTLRPAAITRSSGTGLAAAILPVLTTPSSETRLATRATGTRIPFSDRRPATPIQQVATTLSLGTMPVGITRLATGTPSLGNTPDIGAPARGTPSSARLLAMQPRARITPFSHWRRANQWLR